MANQRPFCMRTVPVTTPEDDNFIAPRLFAAYPGLTCRVTAFYLALRAGHIPHELHTHEEGELLVLLGGRVDLLLDGEHSPMMPGDFCYLPPGTMHTLRTADTGPARLLCLKLGHEGSTVPGPHATAFIQDSSAIQARSDRQGAQRQRLLDGHLLACGGHLSVDRVRYPATDDGLLAHAHDHDVLYLLLEGALHGSGWVTQASTVIYYPAGMVHGVWSASPDLDMLVFEFHG